MNAAAIGACHNIWHILHMSKTPAPENPSMSVNVRVSGALREHVERSASEGDYESVSEYVRDLIRKDKAAKEEAAFQRLKGELQAAFAVPDSEYHTMTAEEIRAFAKQRRK